MLEFLSGFIIQFIHTTSYFGVFFLMAIAASIIPIPSEVILPFSGSLVFTGALSYIPTVLVAALGDVVGSIVLYYIGYFLGETVIYNLIKKHGKYVLISEHEYETATKWFKRYGDKLVLIGKMLPGLRFIISLPAGVFKMDLKKFIVYAFIGALIYSAIFVEIGNYLGSKWDSIGGYFHKFELLIIILLVLAVVWYLDHKLELRKKLLKK